MKKKIYYAVRSNGDGSSSVCFFQTEEAISRLVDYDSPYFDDDFTENEGEFCSFEVDGEITGINFKD